MASDAAALIAQEERTCGGPNLVQIARGRQQRMLLELVGLRFIRLLAVDRDSALLQVEVLDVESGHLAHAEGVLDEQAHQQRVSGLQKQIVRAAARTLGPGG